MTNALHRFEGHDVVACKIEVTNAGDGLSQGMKVQPLELKHGQKVFVVLETEVVKVRFDPDTGKEADPDDLIRVQVLRASAASMVDESLVADVLADQRERIRVWNEEQEGIQRLDLDGEDVDDVDLEQAVDDEVPADPDDADWEASGRSEAPAAEPKPVDEVTTARRRRAAKSE